MNYFSIPAYAKYIGVALNVSTRNSIVINVKSFMDVNVGLTRDPDSYTANTMYEIVIGGFSNTKYIFR